MKQRKDGRYCKKVVLPNGTTKYFYSTASSEREAKKDFNQQLLDYQQSQKDKTSFSVIADNWETDYLTKISMINYKKCSKSAFERAVKHFKNYYIDEIEIQDIDFFITSLCNEGYSRKTISTQKSILNMIFRYAILNGYLKYNPVVNIKLKSNLPKTQRPIPDTDEIKIVDSHYTGFDLLPYFLLYTGLRISEALALSDEDFDMKNKTLRVNKHVVWDGNAPQIENRTKTESGTRTVAILDRLYEKLPKFKGLLFSNADGSLYKRSQLRISWLHYQKTYNLTLTAHQLRHAYATMLFEAGIDEKDAQELMGHSDINLTRSIYTHIRKERKQQAVDKLNTFNF